MTLVERFIEVNAWSTSRKTVLLMSITLPAHLLGWLVLIAAQVDTQVVNMVVVHAVVAGGAVVLLVCLLAGGAMVWMGREGRWTGYLVGVLYGAYVIAVIQTAGNWSTPFFSWYPIGVIVLTLWFDERIGAFSRCSRRSACSTRPGREPASTRGSRRAWASTPGWSPSATSVLRAG